MPQRLPRGPESLASDASRPADPLSPHDQAGVDREPTDGAGLPLAERLEVEVAGRSHVGRRRADNQDHFLVGRSERAVRQIAGNLPAGSLPESIEESAWFFVVADGLGGAAAGEVASRLAIEAGVQLHALRSTWYLRATPELRPVILERSRQLMRAIDVELARAAASDRRLAGMGTTMTIASTIGAELFVAHVGDSRASLFRDGRFVRLTRDHTVIASLVDMGALDAESAERHPLRHLLAHALGRGAHDLPVEVSHRELQHGDVLLMSSDGLHGVVPDDVVAEVLTTAAATGEGIDATADRLIEAALDAGGPDNVTVVLARFRVPQA
jgi:serine/threonine protein phosphatase PrpC